jgi:hypothetical protein
MATREHGLFRLLDHPAPDAAKGGCYVTYGTGPCVDLGVLIEFEGTLTLSTGTIKELAEVAGFTVDDEAFALEKRCAELELQNQLLTAERNELREQLDAVGLAVAHAAQIPAEPKRKPVPAK